LADKYWIGPAGGLASDDTNWSTTSGGTNDTTAPVSGDVAHFDSGGDTNCTWDIDDSVDIVLDSSYTSVVSISGDLTTNGLNSIDIGGGYFYLNGNAIGLDPSASSYIRSGGALRPTGTLQSSTPGTAIPLYVYGSVDWDYGGSGSEVYLKDVELHLKTDTTTGGGGVTITFEDSDIYVDLDDSPSGDVTRYLTVSDGDTWINKGTNEIVNNGDSTYSANLYIYSYGTYTYDSDQETVIRGGSSTQRGSLIIIRGTYTFNKITIHNHDVDPAHFGYYYGVSINYHGDMNIDSGALVRFYKYYDDASTSSTHIFGQSDAPVSINGDIILKRSKSDNSGSGYLIFKGYDSNTPVTVNGNITQQSVESDVGIAIENAVVNGNIANILTKTMLDANISISGDVDDIQAQLEINDDIEINGTMTLNGGSITSAGNALTIGGISGTGTLTLTNGSLTGADCNFDNVSYTIKGTTLTNCVNVGTNDIWTLLAKDDGTAASNWHFKMPGTKIALTNRISKTKIVGTKL